MQVVFFVFKLQVTLLLNWLASSYYYFLFEDGAVQDEGMKLAVLPTCIDCCAGLFQIA